MNEHEPIATRAEREIDALALLKSRKPILFWSVIIIGVLLFGLNLFNQFFGMPKLREENERLRQRNQERLSEINRLETQLAPFKIFALENYPGDESKALERLSQEIAGLQQKIESVESIINAFAVQLIVKSSAKWVEGNPPVTPGIMVLGSNPDLVIEVIIDTGESRELELQIDGLARIEKEDNIAILGFKAEAPPKSWILGFDSRKIKNLGRIQSTIYGINRSTVADDKIRIEQILAEVYINGQMKSKLDQNIGRSIKLPEKERNPTFILGPPPESWSTFYDKREKSERASSLLGTEQQK